MGVIDTGDKIVASFVDTGCKFGTGINNAMGTGEKMYRWWCY